MKTPRPEPNDRNKTTLTHVATATVAAWLDGLGCKPVETEVGLADGWIADLASFWMPTLTEARNAKLLRDLIPGEAKKRTYEDFARMVARVGSRLTIAVEVKTARADFLADRGRKYALLSDRTLRPSLLPPAHLMVLAAPASVVKDDEAYGWGTLRLSEDCKRVVKWAGCWSVNALHPYQVEDLIAAVAVRRDHVTRYQSLRRWMKLHRADVKVRRYCRVCGETLELGCAACLRSAGVAGAATPAIASDASPLADARGSSPEGGDA